jgi:hypothetical protein
MKQLLPGICSAITFYVGIVSKNNVYWAIVYFHLSVRTANLSHVLQFSCQNKQHSLLFSWQSLVRFVKKIYIYFRDDDVIYKYYQRKLRIRNY